jgi:hypothetical protein
MSIESTSDNVPETPPKTTNRALRLGYMYRAYGFLPSSKDELTDAFGLALYLHKGEDAEDKLRVVHEHQVITLKGKDPKYDETANRTVRTIVRGYAGHYRRAGIAYAHLDRLSKNLAGTSGLSPESPETLVQVYSRDDIAIQRLVEFADLRKMAEDGARDRNLKLDPLASNYNPNTKGTVVRSHIDDFMGNTTLYDAWRISDDAMADKFAKIEFWRDRLVEAKPDELAQILGSTALSSSN